MILDRLLGYIQSLVRDTAPSLTYFGTFAYTVTAAHGSPVTSLDVTIVSQALTLPKTLKMVSLRPSALADTVNGVALGQACTVEFLNGDPSRYVVTSLSAASGTATIDATGTMAVGPSVAGAVSLGGGATPMATSSSMITVQLPIGPLAVQGVIGVIPFIAMIVLPGPAVGIVTAGNPDVLVG